MTHKTVTKLRSLTLRFYFKNIDLKIDDYAFLISFDIEYLYPLDQL